MRDSIWIVNHYAGGPGLGTGWRSWELGRRWTRAGSAVKIFTASSAIGGEFAPSRQHDTVIDGVEFHFVAVPGYQNNGLGRLRNILAFNRAVGARLRQVRAAGGHGPRVVIASSPQPFVWASAARFAGAVGALFVPEVRDIWPESLEQLAGMGAWHPLVLWSKRTNRVAFGRASAIASSLPNFRSYLELRGFGEKRCIIIPNGVDRTEEDSGGELTEPIARVLEVAASANRSVLMYAGAIGIPNCVDQLLDAVALLPASDRQRLCCLVIGDGTQRRSLEARARSITGAMIEFVGPAPQGVVCRSMRQCKSGFLSWLDRPIYRYGVSPQKLPLMLAHGLPVVHGAPQGWVERNPDTGWQCRGGDVAGIARAISSMLDADERKMAQLRENCRVAARVHYCWDTIAMHALDSLREL